MGFLVCVTNAAVVTKLFQSRISKAQRVHKQPQLPASTQTTSAEAQIQLIKPTVDSYVTFLENFS